MFSYIKLICQLLSWFLFLMFFHVKKTYIAFVTMAELCKMTLEDKKGSGSQSLSFFPSFLIQLLQQPLVKKVESEIDTLNIYLEEVWGQELNQSA